MAEKNYHFHVSDRFGGHDVEVYVPLFRGSTKSHKQSMVITVWTSGDGPTRYNIRTPHDDVLEGDEDIDAIIEGLQLARTLSRSKIIES